jgi:hypothetical protein
VVELLLVRTSPHEEYSKLNGILRLAQLHRPNSGMSDDVALLHLGDWSVESVRSVIRAIFSRLRVSRSAAEGGRMAFKLGR